jgi:rRNA maturation protein Nop10
MKIERWIDTFHYGFGYTVCPYCGDETEWCNPVSSRYRFQSDLENNKREYCPKCGKRVFARKGWIINQPPEEDKCE